MAFITESIREAIKNNTACPFLDKRPLLLHLEEQQKAEHAVYAAQLEPARSAAEREAAAEAAAFAAARASAFRPGGAAAASSPGIGWSGDDAQWPSDEHLSSRTGPSSLLLQDRRRGGSSSVKAMTARDNENDDGGDFGWGREPGQCKPTPKSRGAGSAGPLRPMLSPQTPFGGGTGKTARSRRRR